jgi:transketolase
MISGRDAFGQALLDLAAAHPEMVVLDADVSSSTKTAAFGKKYPERFFNVGVAEANMADIAGGMATCGLRPVVSTFALFLTLKAADQIRNVTCYNNLPVIFAGGYGGLSDSYDGASHQSIEDLAIMRALPNMAVVVPGDPIEVKSALEQALRRNGPTYLRLGRNPSAVLFADAPALEIGRIRKLRDGGDVTIAVCGIPTGMALAAVDELAARGVQAELLEVSTLKPLDADALVASARKTGRVLTVEEHSVIGGLGGAVAECLCRRQPVPIDFVGVPDCFAESGDYVPLMAKYGISPAAIVAQALNLLAAGPARLPSAAGDHRPPPEPLPPMTTYRCDHVHLKAGDVERTARWYVDTLGAKITFEGQFKGSKVYYLEIGGFTFIVFGQLQGEEGAAQPIEPSLRTRFGVDHFGFAVEEMDVAVGELRAKGVNVLERPWSPRPGLRICYIEAPDRVRIELSERKAVPPKQAGA